MNFPPEKQALILLNKYKLPSEVIKHTLEVRKNALIISARLISKGEKLNLELIKSAALLHDLGRWKYSSQNGYNEEQGIMHVYETHRLLRNLGYHKFAKICASHSLGGLNRKECKLLFGKNIELIPFTLEAKIINVADKISKKNNYLNKIIKFYLCNPKYDLRYYNKVPALKKLTIKRFTKIWDDLSL